VKPCWGTKFYCFPHYFFFLFPLFFFIIVPSRPASPAPQPGTRGVTLLCAPSSPFLSVSSLSPLIITVPVAVKERQGQLRLLALSPFFFLSFPFFSGCALAELGNDAKIKTPPPPSPSLLLPLLFPFFPSRCTPAKEKEEMSLFPSFLPFFSSFFHFHKLLTHVKKYVRSTILLPPPLFLLLPSFFFLAPPCRANR